MPRRSFRSGLLAGVLTALVIALVRILQARRAGSSQNFAPPSSWPPVPSPDEAAEPGMEAPRPEPGRITTAPAGRAAPAADRETATVVTPPDLTPDPSVAVEPETTIVAEPLVEAGGAPSAGAAGPAGDIASEPAGRAEPLGQPWVETGDGECRDGYPVKVKLSSGIFHVPGGLNYARCKADRCYVSEEAAIADGFTKAKR